MKRLLLKTNQVLASWLEGKRETELPSQMRHLEQVYVRACEAERHIIEEGVCPPEVLAEYDLAHVILGAEAHIDGRDVSEAKVPYKTFRNKVEEIKGLLLCDQEGVPLFTDANVDKACSLALQNFGGYKSDVKSMTHALKVGSANCSTRTKFITSILKALFPGIQVYADMWMYTNADFGHVFPVVKFPESGELYAIDMNFKSNPRIEKFEEELLVTSTADYLYMIGYIREIMKNDPEMKDEETPFKVNVSDAGILQMVLNTINQGERKGQEGGGQSPDLQLIGVGRMKRFPEEELVTQEQVEIRELLVQIFGMTFIAFIRAFYSKPMLATYSVLIAYFLHAVVPYMATEDWKVVEKVATQEDVFVRYVPGVLEEAKDGVPLDAKSEEGAPVEEGDASKVLEQGKEEIHEGTDKLRDGLLAINPELKELARRLCEFSGPVREGDSMQNGNEVMIEETHEGRTPDTEQLIVGVTHIKGNSMQLKAIPRNGKVPYQYLRSPRRFFESFSRLFVRDASAAAPPELLKEALEVSGPSKVSRPPSTSILRFVEHGVGCTTYTKMAGVRFSTLPESFVEVLAHSEKPDMLLPEGKDQYNVVVQYDGYENDFEKEVYVMPEEVTSEVEVAPPEFVCERGRVTVQIDEVTHAFMEWDVRSIADQDWVGALGAGFAKDMSRLEFLHNGDVRYFCSATSESSAREIDFPTSERVEPDYAHVQKQLDDDQRFQQKTQELKVLLKKNREDTI